MAGVWSLKTLTGETFDSASVRLCHSSHHHLYEGEQVSVPHSCCAFIDCHWRFASPVDALQCTAEDPGVDNRESTGRLQISSKRVLAFAVYCLHFMAFLWARDWPVQVWEVWKSKGWKHCNLGR